jgi:hypothetical protein
MKPSKTFDISSPSGLLLKLRYDIARLKKSRWTLDIRYAAFDCAVAAWHLCDWLLASVNDNRYAELCGQQRGERRSPAIGFIDRNSHRLPGIRECQLIANTGKHLILTMPDDPSVSARTTVQFDPPFDSTDPASWSAIKITSVAYIQSGAARLDAVQFFSTLERAWRRVLADEGHLDETLADEEVDFDAFDPLSFDHGAR